MKTSKQLSEQVFEKISKYENMRLQFRKKVRKTFAVCIMLGFLLPTAVYFSITSSKSRYSEVMGRNLGATCTPVISSTPPLMA